MKVHIHINLFFEDNIKKPLSKNKIQNNLINLLSSFRNCTLLSQDNILLLIEYDIFEWEKVVFDLIILSQKIAYSWTVTGSINFDYSAFSNKTKISGLKSINIECGNPLYSNSNSRRYG